MRPAIANPLFYPAASRRNIHAQEDSPMAKTTAAVALLLLAASATAEPPACLPDCVAANLSQAHLTGADLS